MLRRLYLRYMRWRGVHVLAADCWCNPVVVDYSEGGSVNETETPQPEPQPEPPPEEPEPDA